MADSAVTLAAAFMAAVASTVEVGFTVAVVASMAEAGFMVAAATVADTAKSDRNQ